jgi:hypothetical protein
MQNLYFRKDMKVHEDYLEKRRRPVGGGRKRTREGYGG